MNLVQCIHDDATIHADGSAICHDCGMTFSHEADLYISAGIEIWKVMEMFPQQFPETFARPIGEDGQEIR